METKERYRRDIETIVRLQAHGDNRRICDVRLHTCVAVDTAKYMCISAYGIT